MNLKVKEKLKRFLESRARNRNQTQGVIYILVGGYLCYIAYSLVRAALTEDGTMPLLITVLFTVFFVLFGLTVAVIGAYTVWYQNRPTQDPDPETDPTARNKLQEADGSTEENKSE